MTSGLFGTTHNLYGHYPLPVYQLDYTSNTGGPLHPVAAFNAAVNWFQNLVWHVYLFVVYLMIHVLTWALDTNVIRLLLGQIRFALNDLNHALFAPVWPFMAAVAVCWMVIYLAMRRASRSIETMLVTGLLIGFSGWVFHSLPGALITVNHVSNVLSTHILDTMVATLPGGHHTAPLTTVGQALWASLASDPYKILEFGTLHVSPMAYHSLMADGLDTAKRVRWFVKYPQYASLTTAAALGTRMTYELIMMLLGLGFVVAIGLMGFAALWWQFVAMARAVVAAFTLLVALWPEHGLPYFWHWLWEVISALAYHIFLAAILALGLVLYIGILALVPTQGWIPTLLLEIAMMSAVYFVAQQVRKTLFALKLPNGQVLGGAEETPGASTGQRIPGMVWGTAGGLAGLGLGVMLGHPEGLQPGSVGSWLAQRQRNHMEEKALQGEMAQRGLDWHNPQDRQQLQTLMQQEGQPQALQERMRRALATRQPVIRPQEARAPRVQATMGDPGRAVWTMMATQHLNPLDAQARNTWGEQHPDFAPGLAAIQQWQDAGMPVADAPNKNTWDYIPPREPESGTPEHAAWQQHFQADRAMWEESANQVMRGYITRQNDAQGAWEAQPFWRKWGKEPPVIPAPDLTRYQSAFQKWRQYKTGIFVPPPSDKGDKGGGKPHA